MEKTSSDWAEHQRRSVAKNRNLPWKFNKSKAGKLQLEICKKIYKKMNLTVGLFGFHLTKSRRWIEATLKVNSESVKRLQLSLSVKSKQFSSEFNCRWIQEEFGSWIELKFRKNKTSQSMKSVVELNRVPVGCSFFLWLFLFQLKASFRVQ